MNVQSPINGHSPVITGFCHDRFSSVKEAFERNFREHGEVGAAVAIYLDGEPVVDLWSGIADAATDTPWDRNTALTIFSAGKCLAAACLHVLIDRGQLDLDAPIARYWPEFAANGKNAVTVALAMSHQLGLPLWQSEVPPGGLLDWELATEMLANEPLIWEPGTTHGYHGIAIGFLWGELVRRITGMSIGAFAQQEIAGPLGADIWFGLPETDEARVATLIPGEPDASVPMVAKIIAEPDWIGGKMATNLGDLLAPEMLNARAFRAAELPAVGGVGNARGLARLYAPLSLDGSLDGVRIVGAEALPLMRVTRSASACDTMLRIATAFSYGFGKTWGRRQDGAGSYAILGEQAFGAVGMGGSVGFADGEARMSFGYVMNRLGPGVALNERGQSLIDAAYRAVGYASDTSGVWVR